MANSDSAAVELDQLTKTYRTGLIRSKPVKALRGVSFTVGRGEIFGLLGPNGAGKTTTIKVLLGIVGKTSGSARMLGYPAGDIRGRRDVGYLPETHRIPRHHTANSALEYYGALSGLSLREIRQRRPGLLELVGLKDWGKTPVRKFSKGMQQRLGLAQAMLHDPAMLILDEPTDGVDPGGRKEIRDILESLKRQGKTIFINSHLLQEVELVCDRIAIQSQGHLVRVGTIAELTQSHDQSVDFVIAGASDACEHALREQPVTSRLPVTGDAMRVTLNLETQAGIDAVVDRLRAASISILSLSRRRVTLEDAFLKLIREFRPPASNAD